MSYSTRAEVRDMVKDDALNAIIGDTFIEDPVEREELVSPIIDAAIADADAEIDGYLAKRYAVPLAPAPRVINKFSKDDSLLKAQVAVQVMITFNGGVYRDTGFAPLTDVRVTSVEKIT